MGEGVLVKETQFTRPGRRLEGKILTALREIGGEGIDWIDPAQGRDSVGTLLMR
jgi:hypothetical protein